jgi:hypothetical protein
MGYKLIALDIDGTIRSEDYPLSERTRKTIDRVRKAGAVVTVATGRVFTSAARMSAELDITSPILSFQGAYIANPVTEEVYRECPLAPHMTHSALDALEQYQHMEVMGQTDREVIVRKRTPWIDSYGQRNHIAVRVLDDHEAFAAAKPMRLVVIGEHEDIRLLEASLQRRFGVHGMHITRSLPHFCEILSPSSGKDKALAWLCTYLGIGQRETIAFGNGYNDVQMLQWAGLGVAIGGAVDEALAAADVVARPIEEDGAARLLEGLLENGEIG